MAICGRRAEHLDAVAAGIAAAGGTPVAVTADVSRESEVQGFISAAVERFGRLDVVMCNAGYGLYGAIYTIEAASMQRIFDVNYMGTFHAIRAALPIFRRQRSGHVIVISSIVGKRGIPYMGPYAATKFAQVGLAESLRPELAAAGIHLSVVFPVSTDTEFFSTMSRESGMTTQTHGPRQHPASVAEAIAHAIERPVPEVYPLKKARALVWLNAIAPGWCDRVVQKYGRKPIDTTPAE